VWDEFIQGLILSSFYWGYIVTQLPGGRLAEVFGPKHVLSVSLLGTALVTMFVPLATKFHYALVIMLRIAMGLLEVSREKILLPNCSIFRISFFLLLVYSFILTS
jgi:MFS family permease